MDNPNGTAGGGPLAGPADGTTAADSTAPVVRRARLSRRRFRVGREATAVSAATGGGTVLSFSTSEAGTLTRGVAAGEGRVALRGRLGRRKLAPGTYRLTLVARDAAGNASRAVRLALAIVRR